MARAVNFFIELEIFYVRFGIGVPKDKQMGAVAIALPKNGARKPAYRSNSARH